MRHVRPLLSPRISLLSIRPRAADLGLQKSTSNRRGAPGPCRQTQLDSCPDATRSHSPLTRRARSMRTSASASVRMSGVTTAIDADNLRSRQQRFAFSTLTPTRRVSGNTIRKHEDVTVCGAHVIQCVRQQVHGAETTCRTDHRLFVHNRGLS